MECKKVNIFELMQLLEIPEIEEALFMKIQSLKITFKNHLDQINFNPSLYSGKVIAAPQNKSLNSNPELNEYINYLLNNKRYLEATLSEFQLIKCISD